MRKEILSSVTAGLFAFVLAWNFGNAMLMTVVAYAVVITVLQVILVRRYPQLFGFGISRADWERLDAFVKALK